MIEMIFIPSQNTKLHDILPLCSINAQVWNSRDVLSRLFSQVFGRTSVGPQPRPCMATLGCPGGTYRDGTYLCGNCWSMGGGARCHNS